MPKYKKCPRCQLNYIPEEEEYCSICRDELRGIKVDEDDEDIYTKTCPRCGVLIPDDMDYCENCRQDLEDKAELDDEENWDNEEGAEESGEMADGDDEGMDGIPMPEDDEFGDEEFGDEEEPEEEEEFFDDEEEEDYGFDNNVGDPDDYDDEEEDDASDED